MQRNCHGLIGWMHWANVPSVGRRVRQRSPMGYPVRVGSYGDDLLYNNVTNAVSLADSAYTQTPA